MSGSGKLEHTRDPQKIRPRMRTLELKGTLPNIQQLLNFVDENPEAKGLGLKDYLNNYLVKLAPELVLLPRMKTRNSAH